MFKLTFTNLGPPFSYPALEKCLLPSFFINGEIDLKYKKKETDCHGEGELGGSSCIPQGGHMFKLKYSNFKDQ